MEESVGTVSRLAVVLAATALPGFPAEGFVDLRGPSGSQGVRLVVEAPGVSSVGDSVETARRAAASVEGFADPQGRLRWDLRLRSDRGLERFVFQAVWDGVEVFDSARSVARVGDRWVLNYSAGGLFDGWSNAEWELTDAEAITTLAKFLGSGPPATRRAKQVWFPLNGRLLSAWEIYFDSPDAGAYQAVVGAEQGRILFLFPLKRRADPVGRVFEPSSAAHPDKGSATLEPWVGYPDGGGCPADVYPSQLVGGAQAGQCWTDGAETVGGNADVCLDLLGQNICNGRALGAGGVFDYPFSDAYGASANPVPDRPAALSNAFYWVNAVHDWLYRLGFDEAAGAFQQDNFGRGGLDGDAVRVDVQDASNADNASFITPPDGIAPRMELGLFTGARRDSAFDGDVIVHEYVHGLTSRMIGGPTNVAGLFLWHSGGLAEGWSDAYATVFTDDPLFGEYVARNPSFGIRTVRYDQSPHTFGSFGLRAPVVAPGTAKVIPAPQVHADGEIWATVLWDLYQALGKAAWETTVTEALALTPPRPSMLDARDAILTAAQAGGIEPCALWPVFAGRGFGASAALNPIEGGWPNDAALSVFESFDSPSSCGGSAPAEAAVFSDGAESDAGWTATGLWHRTTRRAASGSSSWWFGFDSVGGYGTGSRETGELISPPIDLTQAASATLQWMQFFRGAGFFKRVDLGSLFAPYLNQDAGRVWISIDGGGTWQALTHIAHDSPGSGFVPFRINLSRFVGSTIRLKFEFDTLDGVDNAHEGWFIDDIRVTASGAGPALGVSPGSLDFFYTLGGAPPPAAQIQVVNTGDPGLAWAPSSLGSFGWLSLSPNSGTEDGVISVDVQPAGLQPGVYNETVRVDAGTAGAADVAVQLTVDPAVGPVAQWSFEEPGGGPGIGLADATGVHHAQTAGPGSARVQGVAGQARIFDGYASYAAVPASPDLTPTSFSVRVWVKLLSLPNKVGVVVSAFGGLNSRGWYLAIDSAGRPVWMLAQPGSTPWLVGAEALTPGRWTMLTATYDGSTRAGRIYLDGVQTAAATFPGLAADTTRPLTFGKASWADTWFLHAAVDEATIVRQAMSPADVAADFASFDPPAPPANLAVGGDWSFDSTLADSSGNGRGAAASGGSYTAGVLGAARRFDGVDDFASIPVDELVSSADMTVRAWVRLNGQPSAWGVVAANYNADFEGWYLGVLASGKAFIGLASQPNNLPSAVTSSSLGAGRWRHVTAVYEGRTRRLSIYLDGALEDSRYVAGMTPRTSGSMMIGKASWTDAHYLSADLDELRTETRAWTASDVLSDFLSYPTPAGPGPVASWSFDELVAGTGATLADDSENGHDLTTNGATASQSGVVGAARTFGGATGWASAAPSADFSSDSFTLSTWVRLDAFPASWGAIFSTYDGSHRGWYVGVRSSGQVVLCIGGEPSYSPWLVSSSSLLLGRWHHVAVTFEGGTRQGTIYIDGVRESGAAFPAWTPQTGVAPTFAKASWGGFGYLPIWIDEARLFDYARPQSAIAAEAAAGSSRRHPEPLAEWSFNEPGNGAGTVLTDSVAGRDATVQGLGGTAEAGPYGGARRFAGAPDYAVVSTDPELSPPTFSWTGWVRLDALPSGFGVIFANHAGDSRGWHGSVFADGRLILAASGQPSSNPWLLSQNALTPGQWRHVAFTFDGIARRGAIYLDGVREASAVFPAWTPQHAANPTFGKASWTDSYYLSATLDRIRIYGVELSSQEVEAEID